MAMQIAWVLALMMEGMIEASATRRPSTPRTRSSGSTGDRTRSRPWHPAHERELVFDRFYRSDEARAMSGSGLGLAIVKQIAERHGGTVFVGDAPDCGVEVGFQL